MSEVGHAEQTLAQAIAAFERGFILRALKANNGHREATAKKLGITRKSLWEKLRRHKVSQSELEDCGIRGAHSVPAAVRGARLEPVTQEVLTGAKAAKS